MCSGDEFDDDGSLHITIVDHDDGYEEEEDDGTLIVTSCFC
jgi:hypothetical protein